jgi:hypothetical protein
MVLAFLVGFVLVCYQPFRTLVSLRKVNDYPLYVMHYHGGYFLDAMIETGVENKIYQRLGNGINTANGGAFAAMNMESDVVVGQNYDWRIYSPSVLLFTHPADGYASVSMVSIERLTENGRIDWGDCLKLFVAPYLAMDGMNDQGLTITTTYVSCRSGFHDPNKPTLSSSQIVRLVLDRARDVDQALDLIADYNIQFPGICGHHLIVDAFGNSAVVEYIDGEMVVYRSTELWQVATNFLLAEYNPEGSNAPCWRYIRAYEKLTQTQGKLSLSEAMNLLEEISTNTVWSLVYNLTRGELWLVMDGQYDLIYRFELEMQRERPPWRLHTRQALNIP